MNIKERFKNFLFKKIAQKKHTSILPTQQIKNILIIRDGGIGDAVFSYPLLRELKNKIPNAKIDIYASLNNHFMYEYTPWVNNVYLKHKKRHWFKTWIELLKMKRNHYDIAIDDTIVRFHRTLYTMIINPKFVLASSGSTRKYGFDRSELSYYYRVYQSNNTDIHIVDDRLKVLHFLGITNINNKMDFFLPNKINQNLQTYINDIKKGYKLIALNTDASHKTRTLNTKQIIDLCKLLQNEKIKIIPFCIPSKLNYFNKLIKDHSLTNVQLPFKSQTIYEAAEILKQVDLIITPDTSFVHIASGLDIPTIGLFWNDPTKFISCAPRSTISVALTPKGKEENLKNINLQEIQENAFKILL